jgi:hypothetical protein
MQGCINAGCQGKRAPKFCTVLSSEFAECHHSGVYSYEVAAIFLVNLRTLEIMGARVLNRKNILRETADNKF